MASPGRLPSRAEKDGVFECLRRILAPWVGHGVIIVPGGVGPEVALPRSRLVDATGGKLVEAYKGVGLQRGGVRVPGQVWRSFDPFFHEQSLALKPQHGVGAAQGGCGVVVNEEVLGGDWEGGVAIGAEEEQYRVGEGVQSKVSPILRWGPWLEPQEREATAGIPGGQDPMVRGVPMERGGLYARREPCGRWVYLRGGAQNSQARQPAFVCKKQPERWETGLYGQYVCGGRHDAVGRPSLDLVPEH